MIIKLDILQNLVNVFVFHLVEGIEILSNGALQQERLLWNVSDILPEDVEAEGADVDAVDQDLAFMQLAEPKECLQDRGLASASPADDADFHVRLYGEGEVLNAWLEFDPVLHGRILELDLALLWPVRLLDGLITFLDDVVLALELGVVDEAL